MSNVKKVKCDKSEITEDVYTLLHRDVGMPEILTVMAEEASEVAQAALKLRRAMLTVREPEYTNVTPVDPNCALADLVDEIADLVCTVDALQIVDESMIEYIDTYALYKARRWHKRIREKSQRGM